MLRSIYLSAIIVLVCCNLSRGQETAIEQQYFINKWIYNPAQFDTQASLASLSYRKQWLGIAGAPSYTRAGVQNYQVGSASYLGLLVKHLSDGPFNQYEFLSSVGYQARFSDAASLNFGLSFGYMSRNTDFSQLSDPGDAGLVDVPPNQGSFQGNFGVSLNVGHASIGASVPRIFDEFILDSKLVNTSTPKVFFFSGAYMIETNGSISIEPQLLFHMNNNIGTKQLEFLSTVYYQDKGWLGGSFRENYGASAFIGGAIDRFDLSYIYTVPSVGTEINQSSHEVVLRIKIKENKNAPRKSKQRRMSFDNPGASSDEDVSNSSTSGNGLKALDVNDKAIILEPGYYIITGDFYLKSSAIAMKNSLSEKGVASEVVFIESRESYVVYAGYFKTKEEAQVELPNVRRDSGVGSSWILDAK